MTSAPDRGKIKETPEGEEDEDDRHRRHPRMLPGINGIVEKGRL